MITANPNVRPSDQAPLMARVSPVSQGAGSVSTAYVDASKFGSILATVIAGVLGAAATLDAKLEQATDSSGTGVKDVTGKAITQLTKAGSDDNKEVEINCKQEDLDFAGGFTHVRLTMTVGVAASLIAGTIRGFYARYVPEADATTVDEVK